MRIQNLIVFFILALIASCASGVTEKLNQRTTNESEVKDEKIDDSQPESLALYPKPPIKSDWPRPKGDPFDKDKITPLVISAFFHNAKPPDNITPTLLAYVEIDYKSKTWTPTIAIAVISLIDKNEGDSNDYLAVFSVNKELSLLSKSYERSMWGGRRSYAALSLKECYGEDNPFIYLFYETGGNSRNYSHSLYRIELDDQKWLRRIWNHGDGESHSTSANYSVSNICFYGFDGKEEKCIKAYRTSGIRRYEIIDGEPSDLIPKYYKTIYTWNSKDQAFTTEKEYPFNPKLTKEKLKELGIDIKQETTEEKK